MFLKSIDFKIDIICLQETWCMESSQYFLFQFEHYNYTATCCKASKHGGLITYTHEDFNVNKIKVGEHSDIWESLFIEVSRNNNDC